jgi:hypothetical protein
VSYLSRDLVTSYQAEDLTSDDELVLMTRSAKDKHGIERVKQRFGVTTAAQLWQALPAYRPPSKRKRLLHWLRRLEGSSPTDPLRREIAQDNRRKANELRHGIRQTRLR